MEKIKVFEYIHGLEDGGAETLVKDYAVLMDRQKFDVTVVVNRVYGTSANLRRIQEAGIKLLTIYPCWNIMTKLWNDTMGWWYVPYKLKKIINKEKPRVLHVHLGLLRFTRRLGDALNGVRLFYTCHSTPNRYLGRDNIKEHRAAKELISKHGLQIVALHNDMASEINSMLNISNTVVIHNGVDFSRFNNIDCTCSQKRRELNIPEDAFVIGHIGRFVPVKNHDFLVDVFASVSRKRSNTFLLMVGTGETKAIENKIHALGLQDRFLILKNRTDINEIMRTMDVFVFPSLYEGFGTALIEAQVSGLKCVASDTIPEEAFNTKYAIQLPLGDSEMWADVIMDEAVVSDKLGDLSRFDLNKEIKRLEALYCGSDEH